MKIFKSRSEFAKKRRREQRLMKQRRKKLEIESDTFDRGKISLWRHFSR